MEKDRRSLEFGRIGKCDVNLKALHSREYVYMCVGVCCVCWSDCMQIADIMYSIWEQWIRWFCACYSDALSLSLKIEIKLIWFTHLAQCNMQHKIGWLSLLSCAPSSFAGGWLNFSRCVSSSHFLSSFFVVVRSFFSPFLSFLFIFLVPFESASMHLQQHIAFVHGLPFAPHEIGVFRARIYRKNRVKTIALFYITFCERKRWKWERKKKQQQQQSDFFYT